MRAAEWIEQLKQRFEALEPRERLLIIAAMSLLLWAVAHVSYFSAANQKEKQLQSTVASLRHDLALLEARETVIKAQLSESGLDALKNRIEELKRRRAELDERLLQQGIKLLGPERMRDLLHALLPGSGLRLHALKRLPVERISSSQNIPPASAAASVAMDVTPSVHGYDATLYRHAVQLELDGRFPDMLHYLKQLEASGWQLKWQSLEIETLDYPLARMRLTVYTLSLHEDWIGV